MTDLDVFVCIKPALLVEGAVRIAGSGASPDPSCSRFLVDPGNACALEAALVLRECGQVARVVCVSAGPQAYDATLAWCRAAGADQVLRVDVPADLNLDACATAALLADTIRGLGGKLVLTAQRSIDESNGLIAAALAAALDGAYLSNAVEVQILEGELRISRRVERGHRQLWSAGLPAVVAVEHSATKPRYVSVASLALARLSTMEVLTTGEMKFDQLPRLTELNRLAPGRVRARQSGMPGAGGSAAERMQAMMGISSAQADGKVVFSGEVDELTERALTFLEERGLLRPLPD